MQTHTAPPLEIRVSKRFVKSYERGTAIQFLVEGTVADFSRRYYSDPSSVARNYQRLSGPNRHVMEFEISGGCRMIGYWDSPRLTLLDVGDHELVPRFRLADVPFLLESSTLAPPALRLGNAKSFFISDSPGPIGRYANEIAPDWIYFLDAEQDRLTTELCDAAEDCLLREAGHSIHLVLGGPGTGKTCILLNLLQRLYNRERFSTRLALPRQVKEYLEASLGISLVDVWLPSDEVSFYEPTEPVDILLLDDPRGLDDLTRLADLARRGRVRVIVAAFDPLQLNQPISDSTFDAFVNETEAHVHELRMCYRQKENVGRQTRNATAVIAESTPYLDQSKKSVFIQDHAKLTTLANDLHFCNPKGYLRIWREATATEFDGEVRRISQDSSTIWRHAPSLLIVIADPSLPRLPNQCLRSLERFPGEYKVISSHSLALVKGLEYQHVFIFFDPNTFTALESGFHGSGRQVYNQRRLLRIPFSRAKDSLVIFVWSAKENSPAISLVRR